MSKKFIDLAIAIENGLPSDPPNMIPKINYMDHKTGAVTMKMFFPGATDKDLPGGLGWAVEDVTLSTHSGSHLDAPYHYHPTMSKGQKSLTIDEIPLDWCYGPGVVVDFRSKPDGHRVSAAEMDEAFRKIDHKLSPGDIVLVMTGADKYWGKQEYLVRGCGMGKEATLWLTDRGIRVVGTDAWSWDRPLPLIAKDFQESHDSSIIWEGHFAGIEAGYCHMEKLTNLDKLPPKGFTFVCFPIKVKGASAGWIRPVAIIEE